MPVESYHVSCMLMIQPFILINKTFFKLIEAHQEMWNLKLVHGLI